MKKFALPLLFIIVLAAGGWLWWREAAVASQNGTVTEYLSGEAAEGFALVTEPNAIEFPRDFGPHEEYQTEWWYYTGNLQTADGRDFGYQFTIFRRGLTPGTLETAEASAWRSNQIYFAHFALSDIANEDFYDFEKFSRGAAGLAGAQAEPYEVWIENWSVKEQADGTILLSAAQDEVKLELTLTQTRPPILHGKGGLSQKGPEYGNASYYYSQIRQQTEGTVTIGENQYAVSGLSWKDHEYGTSFLSEGVIGWNWFALQFDDGSALMFAQGVNEAENNALDSIGTFIYPNNTTVQLSLEDVELEVLDTWTSPTSGGEYPAAWRMTIPSLNLQIMGEPLMANQELNVSTTYWEGAVRFSGTRNDAAVTAVGYVELTGYADSLGGRL